MSILHEFKSLAAQTSETVEGVTQDFLFDIAMFLKQSMNEKGLSQREFAKQIGMKESQLSLILNTERNITAETISRLYWAFRCRPRVAIREEEFVADNLIADNMISFPVKSATTPSEGFINSMTVETKYINSCEVAHG